MKSTSGSDPILENVTALFEATNAIAPRICSSLSPIIGCSDPAFGEVVGTASFIALKNGIFLLTAAHVAKKAMKYPLRCFSKRQREIFDASSQRFIFHPNPDVDLAVWPICKKSSEVDPIIPISSQELGSNTSNLADILVLGGYPGCLSRYSAIGESLVSTIQPYGTVEGKSDLPFFNPLIHFAIEYPQIGQKNINGLDVELPEPRGLSGSVVWKSNRIDKDAQEWEATDARVIGLIHRWDVNNQSLIATRIEVLLDFFKLVEKIEIKEI